MYKKVINSLLSLLSDKKFSISPLKKKKSNWGQGKGDLSIIKDIFNIINESYIHLLFFLLFYPPALYHLHNHLLKYFLHL